MDSNFPGIYKGFVVDNQDPQKRGRLRFIIPQVFGEGENDAQWSNWAEPCFGTYVDFKIPTIGAMVWVMFEMGNPRFPVYMGTNIATSDVPAAVVGDDDGTGVDKGTYPPGGTILGNRVPDAQRNVAYPNNNVWRTPDGIQIEVDDSENARRIQIYHPSGTFDEVYEDGSSSTLTCGNVSDFTKADRIEYTSENKTVEVGLDKEEVVGNNSSFAGPGGALLMGIEMDGPTLRLTINGLFVSISATGTLLLNGRVVLPSGGPI